MWCSLRRHRRKLSLSIHIFALQFLLQKPYKAEWLHLIYSFLFVDRGTICPAAQLEQNAHCADNFPGHARHCDSLIFQYLSRVTWNFVLDERNTQQCSQYITISNYLVYGQLSDDLRIDKAVRDRWAHMQTSWMFFFCFDCSTFIRKIAHFYKKKNTHTQNIGVKPI